MFISLFLYVFDRTACFLRVSQNRVSPFERQYFNDFLSCWFSRKIASPVFLERFRADFKTSGSRWKFRFHENKKAHTDEDVLVAIFYWRYSPDMSHQILKSHDDISCVLFPHWRLLYDHCSDGS